MRFSLLPKENIFYKLLEELIKKTVNSINLFIELTESWNFNHPNILKLKELEHDCDHIVHDIMVKLNKTFVTPIDREDIHYLTKKIDDIVDIIQALSARMVLFQIQNITANLKDMTIVLKKSIETIALSIPQIKSLKHPHNLFENCIYIHTLENQGDRLFEKALGEIFLDTSNPLEVIKWKEIYDFLEKAIDTCEDVADILWGITVKYG